MVVARVSDHLSQSTCFEMLHPKTDEHLNPGVEVHHLVGKLSTAETLLTVVQRKVPTCPCSFVVINVRNQGKTLCSSCIFDKNCVLQGCICKALMQDKVSRLGDVANTFKDKH